MSTSDGDDEGVLRTVTPLSGLRPNQQMDLFGWLIFVLMAIVLLPLLPVFAVVWVLSKVTGR